VRNVNKNHIIQNVSSIECFKILSNVTDSYLVDVRTLPEWEFVGVPNLSIINKETIFVSFLIYPDMDENKNFEKKILDQGIQKNNNLYFICRSGQRSLYAAEFLINSGFSNCFNVHDGFEGDQNQHKKRSLINGWKYNNLPWKQ
jgi:rhodanese-related sulfurtransferase